MTEPSETAPSRLQLLKQRATMMGIPFSNNIGEDALSKKIAEKMGEGDEAEESQDENQEEVAQQPNPLETPAPVASKPRKKSLQKHLYEENMRLVRVRIQNLDPKKASLHGEIIAVGNEHLGMTKMFVPFGETTDEGWHIPYIIYKALKARKFLDIKPPKKGSNAPPVTRWVREFSLEILPPLSEAELEKLKVAQMASGVIETQDALTQ